MIGLNNAGPARLHRDKLAQVPAAASMPPATRPSQTWGWYWFRVVIDLGNGMKWRVLLELTEANGHVQTHEMVTGDRPTNATSPETIGLTLAESKSVLAAMQTQLVQAQVDGYCRHRRKCAHCGSRRAIKDWRTRQL